MSAKLNQPRASEIEQHSDKTPAENALDPARGLERLDAYGHPAQDLQQLQTHGSRVFLAGEFAYKIKKPVKFDFLDYSTVELRHHFCEQELEVNRFFAPELYLQVVPVYQDAGGWNLLQRGKLCDWAVQMRRFDQRQMLAPLLAAGCLAPSDLVSLADYLADLHDLTRVAFQSTKSPQDASGARLQETRHLVSSRLPSSLADQVPGDLWPRDSTALQRIVSPVVENAQQFYESLRSERDRSALQQLLAWTENQIQTRQPIFQERIDQGRIRECHGDLHLGNLIFQEGKFLAFDAIEFNQSFRWIDVANEIAFLVMDLEDCDWGAHAARVLDRYLERSGDYELLKVLRFYLVYRALVRGRVQWLRQQQDASQQSHELDAHAWAYVNLAQRYQQTQRPQLLITHGLSGSGKSTAALQRVEQKGMIRLRSDAVRKRLLGLKPEESTESLARSEKPHNESFAYSRTMSEQTYAELWRCARLAIEQGWSVVVDATFLHATDRESFRSLAQELGVAFGILNCEAPVNELERRIIQRRSDVSEATLQVLHQQLQVMEPLSEAERSYVVSDEGS